MRRWSVRHELNSACWMDIMVLMFISQSIMDQHQIALVHLLFDRAIIFIRFHEKSLTRQFRRT